MSDRTLEDRLFTDRAPAIFATAREAAARITELEAANVICRRDIEALMSSCDKLEAQVVWYATRIAELEGNK